MQIQLNDNFEIFAITYARRIGVKFQFKENSEIISSTFSILKKDIPTIKVCDSDAQYFQNIKQFLLQNFKEVVLKDELPAYILKSVKVGDYVQFYNHYFILTSEYKLESIYAQPKETQNTFLNHLERKNFQVTEGFTFS